MTVYSVLTHPGCKHELNEDTVGWSEENSLWLVADGMGGHAAGEVASDIAKTRVLKEVAAGHSLLDAVNNAHVAVSEAASRKEDRAGMGTTMVAARLDGYEVEIVWVGDSRAYLWRDSELTIVTTDHSYMQMLIAKNELSPEEAHEHPRRNIVTQVLGVATPEPDRVKFGLHRNDRLLLCSDGLNDELTDVEIAAILKRGADTETTTERLVDAACESGGRDNISAIVIQYDGDSAPAEFDTLTLHHEAEPISKTEQLTPPKITHNPIFWGGLVAILVFVVFWLLRGGGGP